MVTAHHGTARPALPRHPGLCLAIGRDDGYSAASQYARAATDDPESMFVFEVEIDLAGLVVEEVEVDPRECWNLNEWPCDRAEEIAAMVARGVDAIRFADATITGMRHETIRLLSDRAIAALAEIGRFEPEGA